MLNIGGIHYHNLTSAPWVSTEIFVQGCLKNCPECFNQELRQVKKSRIFSISQAYDMLKDIKYKAVTFSGGEPMLQAKSLGKLASRLKADGFTIVCYSGYMFEEIPTLFPGANKLLKNIDILVDGMYMKQLHQPIDEQFKFVGSSNQRILDMHTGTVITDMCLQLIRDKIMDLQDGLNYINCEGGRVA